MYQWYSRGGGGGARMINTYTSDTARFRNNSTFLPLFVTNQLTKSNTYPLLFKTLLI